MNSALGPARLAYGLDSNTSRSFEQDVAAFADPGKALLPMLMLVLFGATGRTILLEQDKMRATNVQGVIVKLPGLAEVKSA